MKQYSLNTNREPVSIRIGLITHKPQTVGFRIEDINKKYTVYNDTFININGKFDEKFQLPISPEICKISIMTNGGGNEFDILHIRKEPLITKSVTKDISNPSIKSFVNFATFFCDNAGILSASSGGKEFSMYSSDDGLFKIKYSDVIRDGKDGEQAPQSTPARIHSQSKIIECSRPKYIAMTVGGRFGILSHEFAHCFENIDPANESEADENAVMIMLNMGFPKVEILNAWINVFKTAPSEANKKRYEKIKYLINNYKG